MNKYRIYKINADDMNNWDNWDVYQTIVTSSTIYALLLAQQQVIQHPIIKTAQQAPAIAPISSSELELELEPE